MVIKYFSYKDLNAQWELSQMTFEEFNLLVGISGVGKTKILTSLLGLKNILEGADPNGVEWEIGFNIGSDHFVWKGAFEHLKGFKYLHPRASDDELAKHLRENGPKLRYESLTGNDLPIIERDTSSFLFNGKEMPRLPSQKSGLHLLAEETGLGEISAHFSRLFFTDNTGQHQDHFGPIFAAFEEGYPEKYISLAQLRNSKETISTKLWICFYCFPKEFSRIESLFKSAFPQVESVSFRTREDADILGGMVSQLPIVHVKERLVETWISEESLSAGMMRTFIHLAELSLCPDGSVILIDEFENSLGVNCLDFLVDEMLHSDRELQFIITSHHPYILNNVDMKYWKIISRKGGKVRASGVEEFNLGNSKHQAFLQLLNSEAFLNTIS